MMKRTLHILLTTLLMATLLFFGMDWDCVRCNCTGVVRMVPCGAVEDTDGCDEPNGCMTVIHLELSPTDVTPSANFSLHLDQPLIAIWTDFIGQWLNIQRPETQLVQAAPDAPSSPPRDYLNRLRILLI